MNEEKISIESQQEEIPIPQVIDLDSYEQEVEQPKAGSVKAI